MNPNGAASAGSHIPPVLLEQTVNAVVDGISKICGTAVRQDATYLGCENREKVVGAISFVGDLMWTMALILPHDSAETMAEKFAGFHIPFESLDMGDVVGEIINVLAGGLCGNLHAVGVSSQMSLPTVTRGNAFEIMLPESLVCQYFYFSTDDSDFCVEIMAMKTL
jgi:CheY-specific phosphatase CheX